MLRAFARPLLALPFICDGVDAMVHSRTHVERARPRVEALSRLVGVEAPSDATLRALTAGVGAAMSVSALSFAVGRAPRTCALTVAALAAPMVLVNAPTREGGGSKEEQRRARARTLRQAGLVGGLLLASVDRVGQPSVAVAAKARREQRALIAEAHAYGYERALREVGQ